MEKPSKHSLSFCQVDQPASRDSYPKCKLKYSSKEKDFTCIKNSSFGGFHTALRSHSNFRVFACQQWILSCCVCCRFFALSSYQTNIIHFLKLTWKGPLQCRFLRLLVFMKVKNLAWSNELIKVEVPPWKIFLNLSRR